MHGSFDKSRKTVKGIYRSWGVGVFVLPALVVAFLIGLAITKPDMSNWISEAEQAEFANSSQVLGVNPTQPAQPAMAMRSVKAY